MSSDAYDAILTCRAVRHFTETPISDDDLQRILQAGRWAGSAKNVQPWHFVVVRNRARSPVPPPTPRPADGSHTVRTRLAD